MAVKKKTTHASSLSSQSSCCHAPLGTIPHLPTAVSESGSDSGSEKAPIQPALQPVAARTSGTLLGEVLNNHAPRTDGKALIEYRDTDDDSHRVLAEIAAGLTVVPGDKVLFIVPANALMAVVTTVLARSHSLPIIADGGAESFSPTQVPQPQREGVSSTKNNLVLKDNDALQVTTATGQTLVAIERGAHGPIVRLGLGDFELDIPGEFHLVADSMQFSSRRGPVRINSSAEDVIVKGRAIRLN